MRRDAGRHRGRAVVDDDAGAVRDRLELPQRHVEPEARREGAGADERVAAADRGSLDARDRDRDALPRFRARDLLVVDLDAPDARLEPARLDPEHVSGRDRPAPERPRGDRADPGEAEDPVDVEPGRGDFVALSH